jgi:hypothetical protein
MLSKTESKKTEKQTYNQRLFDKILELALVNKPIQTKKQGEKNDTSTSSK